MNALNSNSNQGLGSTQAQIVEALYEGRSQNGYRGFYVSLPIWLVFICQCILIAWAQTSFETPGDRTTVLGLKSLIVKFVVITATYQIVNLSLLRLPKVRSAANLSLTLAFITIFAVHAGTEQPLDSFVVGENLPEVFLPETWDMLFKAVPLEKGLTVVNALLVVTVLALMCKPFNRWPAPRQYWTTLIGAWVILIIGVATPLYVQSDPTYMLRSGLDYVFARHWYSAVNFAEEYPYVQRVAVEKKDAATTLGQKPDIFLILMESFSANFVRAKNESGEAFTPTFNSLIEDGVFAEWFYANGVQSAPAKAAVLCSLLPSVRGKVSVKYPNLNLRSLPDILKAHGYRNIGFDGYRTFAFDNMDEFLPNIGFDELQAMDDSILTDDDKQYVWGWGLQDDKLYQKVFQYLDKHYPGDRINGRQPLFVMIATESNHYSFDYLPPDETSPYPKPASQRQIFANSLHLADKYLYEFFEQLASRPGFRDSLVILLGDNGFPAGEHGLYYNEQGFYEEVFRVPLLILWKGHLEGRVIPEPHCELDIAPTVLDLLDIHVDNHFLGKSIFRPNNAGGRAIHLVQPYDGTHLCVVKNGLKYVQSVRVSGEYLFDLKHDPNEQKNVLDKYRGSAQLKDLKQEMSRIWLNQMLIERNRVWPPEEK